MDRFPRHVNKVFNLLRYYAALFGSQLLRFRDSLLDPYSRGRKSVTDVSELTSVPPSRLKQFFVLITLEYGTDRVFRNVGN